MSVITPDASPELTIQVPKYAIKVERNTRGVNWEVTVRGDVLADALAELKQVYADLEATYGKDK